MSNQLTRLSNSLVSVASFSALAVVAWAGSALAQAKLGAEFQVNTYTTEYQQNASVAADRSGNFVVVWQSYGQDGYGYGVFAQRFDSAGNKAGAEFQVNTDTTGYERNASVAADGSGNFVVVWQSNYNQDGDGEGVFGQRFDSTGTKVGAEFQVNTYTTNNQSDASVAADGSGNFVVVWQSHYQVAGVFGNDVFGQRYDSAGTKVGAEFQVNTYTSGSRYNPSVAADPSGSFVVVWESYPQDGSDSGVFGQRYDGTGTKVGAEFQVNTYTRGYQQNASVAADPSGSFVVVWQSGSQDGDQEGVFGQRYDGTGTKVGAEFQVNTYTTGPQLEPVVAADPSGNFVVVWQSYHEEGYYGGAGVFGQRFDSAGNKAGAEFQVNTYTTGYERNASVAADGSGNFVVVWQSEYDQDGDGEGVFGQRFSALRSDCLAAEKQDVSLKDGKLNWSWRKGAATAKTDFGDPTADTAYQVCLYDTASGTPVELCIDIPAGSDWKDQKNGFNFKSQTGVQGITSIQLKAGDAGKAKVSVKGKEVALPTLPLTQQPEVVLQLSNSEGVCWQSSFTVATKNDESKFTAKE